MNHARDITQDLADWLHEPDRLPPPRISEVASLVHRTPQQRGLVPPLPRGFLPMFSATRYLVAGVILALFGGLLLVGLGQPRQTDLAPAVVGASPDATPATTPEVEVPPGPTLLSGAELVTEEVERGVFRIIEDGVRDLEWPGGRVVEGRSVTAGLDGTVLVAENPQGTPGCQGGCTAFRLGSAGNIDWSKKPLGPKSDKNADEWSVLPLEIGPDGTVYARAWGRNGNPDLRAWDGDRWDVIAKRSKDGGVRQIVVDDGTLWVASYPDQIARLTDSGLEPNGSAVALLKSPAQPLQAFDGVRLWTLPSGDEHYVGVARFTHTNSGPAVGLSDDGTMWMLNGAGGIHRFRDGEWETFTIEHEHNEWYMTWFEVAPSGGVWMGTDYYHPPLGLSHFDGETWTRVLDGKHIQAMDMAPDGTIWALAEEPNGPAHLYAVTPAAIGAEE